MRPIHAALFGAICLLFAVPAFAQSGRVAILPLEIKGGVTAGREALGAAVEKGVSVHARSVQGASATGAALVEKKRPRSCPTATCWSATAKALDVDVLMSVVLEKRGTDFLARITARDGTTGEVVVTKADKCDGRECSLADLARSVGQEASRMAFASVTPAPATPVVAEPPPVVPVVQAPPPPIAPIVPAAPPSPARTERAKWPAYSMMGAGVVAAAVGVYLIAIDGRDTECIEGVCGGKRRTLVPGLALGIGGGLLAAGGAFLLVLGSADDESVALRIGPSGLSLSGRF